MAETNSLVQLPPKENDATQRLRLLEDLGFTVIDVAHLVLRKARNLPSPVGKSIGYVEDTLGPWLEPLITSVEEQGLHMLSLADDQINAASEAVVEHLPFASVVISPLYVVLSGQAVQKVFSGLEKVRQRGVVGYTADVWVEFEPVVKDKSRGIHKLVNKVPVLRHAVYILEDIGSPLALMASDWLITHSEAKDKHQHLGSDLGAVPLSVDSSATSADDVDTLEDAKAATKDYFPDSPSSKEYVIDSQLSKEHVTDSQPAKERSTDYRPLEKHVTAPQPSQEPVKDSQPSKVHVSQSSKERVSKPSKEYATISQPSKERSTVSQPSTEHVTVSQPSKEHGIATISQLSKDHVASQPLTGPVTTPRPSSSKVSVKAESKVTDPDISKPISPRVEEQKDQTQVQAAANSHKGKALEVTPPQEEPEVQDELMDLFDTWGMGVTAISPKGLDKLRTLSLNEHSTGPASPDRGPPRRPVSKSFRL